MLLLLNLRLIMSQSYNLEMPGQVSGEERVRHLSGLNIMFLSACSRQRQTTFRFEVHNA